MAQHALIVVKHNFAVTVKSLIHLWITTVFSSLFCILYTDPHFLPECMTEVANSLRRCFRLLKDHFFNTF